VLTKLKPKLPDGLWPFLFLLPYLIGFSIFILTPISNAAIGSFTDWGLFSPEREFIGLENFTRLMKDESFRISVINTIYYVVVLVPSQTILAMFLALLVNRTFRGVTLFRNIYFAPFVMSLASIGMVWSWLYTTDIGLVNRVLSLINITPPVWLHDPTWAMPAVIIASIWRNVGYYMVIFLAWLQNVPEDLIEAAQVDGAGAWQRFRHIILPLLTPAIFFTIMIGVILGFQVFDITYVMTQGGPSQSTLTLLMFIYKKGITSGDLGYASAASLVLLVMMLVFTVLYFYGQKRWVFYQGMN
jgi:multiple sugar transport system permease protein